MGLCYFGIWFSVFCNSPLLILLGAAKNVMPSIRFYSLKQCLISEPSVKFMSFKMFCIGSNILYSIHIFMHGFQNVSQLKYTYYLENQHAFTLVC